MTPLERFTRPDRKERHESFVYAYFIIKTLGFNSFEEATTHWKYEFPHFNQLHFMVYVEGIGLSKFEENKHHPTWFIGLNIDGTTYKFEYGDFHNNLGELFLENIEKKGIIDRLRKPSSSS